MKKILLLERRVMLIIVESVCSSMLFIEETNLGPGALFVLCLLHNIPYKVLFFWEQGSMIINTSSGSWDAAGCI